VQTFIESAKVPLVPMTQVDGVPDKKTVIRGVETSSRCDQYARMVKRKKLTPKFDGKTLACKSFEE
jgi:hypothetical protein